MHFQRPPLRQAKAGDAMQGIITRLDLSLVEAEVQPLHQAEQYLQAFWEGLHRLFLDLPPAKSGAEDEVLLAADGNDRYLRRSHQRFPHARLIPLAERNPLTIHDEVAVVAHALRLFFACVLSEQLRSLVEAE